jgi:hypothetical protein
MAGRTIVVGEGSNLGFCIGEVAAAATGNEQLSPQGGVFLEQDDRRAQLCRSTCGHHAGRASADHEQVGGV